MSLILVLISGFLFVFICVSVLVEIKTSKAIREIRDEINSLSCHRVLQQCWEGCMEEKAATEESDEDECNPLEALDEACHSVAEMYDLSKRESEILPYLARGMGSALVADKCYIGVSTVKSHSFSIYRKLGIHTRDELISLIDEELFSA